MNRYRVRERLIRPEDDRDHITGTLRDLGLWDDKICAVAIDVHRRVGRYLGKALLPNAEAKDYLHRLYDAAIQAGGGEIALHFASNCSHLTALPWEVMHDGVQPILLAHGIALSCIGVIASAHLRSLAHPIGKQLCILFVTSHVQMDSVGWAFEQLARIKIREAFRNLPVHIEELPHATMNALYQRLDRGPTVHIIDYFGYTVVTTDEGGILLFEDAHGGRDPVIANRLARLPNLPSLFVLWGPQSAWVDTHEPLKGIATALNDIGVQGVLAMQVTTPMEAIANKVA